MDDGADALAFVHQIERLVDLLEGMVWVMKSSSELTLHVALYVARQLAATAHAPEGAAAPHPAGDQLERTGADLLARTGRR